MGRGCPEPKAPVLRFAFWKLLEGFYLFVYFNPSQPSQLGRLDSKASASEK